jgi:alkylation response protein AidB-like acyl-CoA dehydrogenase
VDFAFSEEQEMLRESARDFLAGHDPLERVAELADAEPGWDPASWGLLAGLGWLGLSVPEDQGGAGASLLDEAVLFEETGRALYPGPFFATVGLALPALAAAAKTDRASRAAGGADALAGVLAGERPATLAWAESGGPSTLADGGAAACAAARDGDGWRLTGAKRLVPDLDKAGVVVVAARSGADPAGVGLWLVELAGGRAAVVPRSTMDTTRRLGDLVLDATPATLLVAPGEAGPVLAATRLRALAALACEAVGVAERARRFAIEYAGQRVQFDRPIGAYQAVSHRIADAYVACELARSLAYWAAWCVAEADEQAPVACAAAKAAAGEAAVLAAEAAIQCMGGIGFTWDHPLHRLYKRAQWIDAFEGNGAVQRREVAAALLDD